MNTIFATALVAATANAIKQGSDVPNLIADAGLNTETEGYANDIITHWDYSIDNYAAVESEINEFADEKLKPFVRAHRD